jgi:hypothetical protein
MFQVLFLYFKIGTYEILKLNNSEILERIKIPNYKFTSISIGNKENIFYLSTSFPKNYLIEYDRDSNKILNSFDLSKSFNNFIYGNY